MSDEAAGEAAGIPDDVRVIVIGVIDELIFGDFSEARFVIARAILAERQRATEAAEQRMAEILRNPVAVRHNYMRGGIDASLIIRDATEAAAQIADEISDRAYTPFAEAYQHIARAIRNSPKSEGERA